MLFVGIDVVLLLIAGAVIAIGVLLVARRFGLDEASANALSYASMATSGILIVSYVVIAHILDSLC